MTMFLSNRDGNGKTDEEGHFKFPVNAFTGNVLAATDLAVTEQTVPALGVKVAPGQFRIPSTSGTYAYTGWNDANTNVTITTADPANPRLSAIVIYIDKTAATSASPPNNPGIAKFMSVNGTAAAVPAAPSAGVIQAAVGAGNPYIVLAHARVNAAGTTVTNALITDQRTFVKLGPNLLATTSFEDLSIATAKLANLAITTAKIADLNVTTGKIADQAVTAAKIETQQAFIAPSMQNGWINYDANHAQAGYMKDSLGFVHLRGLIKNGAGTAVFVIPAGYRNTKHLHFPIVANSNFAYLRVDISGQVSVHNYTSNVWLSMDGVTWKADA